MIWIRRINIGFAVLVVLAPMAHVLELPDSSHSTQSSGLQCSSTCIAVGVRISVARPRSARCLRVSGWFISGGDQHRPCADCSRECRICGHARRLLSP